MKSTVFIHTNYKQLVGAKVSRYSLRKNSVHSDEFDIRILLAEDCPALMNHHGETYLREGRITTWDSQDLQSFTPVRFLAAQEMNYRGRALVIDPDIFAHADVWDLLMRDMEDKAILCRRKDKRSPTPHYDSSVMVLDCAKLTHWRWEEAIEEMFSHQRDYRMWMSLNLEDEREIGLIEDEWNDYDRLTPDTKLLHNTRRITQPWKTGLPVDFISDRGRDIGKKWGFVPRRWIRQFKLVRKGQFPGLTKHYQRHPDAVQERGFFDLLAACIEEGEISIDELKEAIQRRWVRPDILRLVERARGSEAHEVRL